METIANTFTVATTAKEQFVSLTSNLWVNHIFSYLNLVDVGTCRKVSKSFHNTLVPTLTTNTCLWYNLACQRFGKPLVDATVHLYNHDENSIMKTNNSYYTMLVDDNRVAALPTLLHVPPCRWRYNHHPSKSNVYSCCYIPCIKWHRSKHEVHIYFDVKGASTLRHPSVACQLMVVPSAWEQTMMQVTGTSSMSMTKHYRRNHRTTFLPTSCHVYYQHQEPTPSPGRRHYQGYVVFPESYFHMAGTYYFGYQHHDVHRNLSAWADYKESKIFTITERLGLADFRDYYSGMLHYTGLEPLAERPENTNACCQDNNVDDDYDPNPTVTWVYARTSPKPHPLTSDSAGSNNLETKVATPVKDRHNHDATPPNITASSALCFSLFVDLKSLFLVPCGSNL
jgi:hypothetical protein